MENNNTVTMYVQQLVNNPQDKMCKGIVVVESIRCVDDGEMQYRGHNMRTIAISQPIEKTISDVRVFSAINSMINGNASASITRPIHTQQNEDIIIDVEIETNENLGNFSIKYAEDEHDIVNVELTRENLSKTIVSIINTLTTIYKSNEHEQTEKVGDLSGEFDPFFEKKEAQSEFNEDTEDFEQSCNMEDHCQCEENDDDVNEDEQHECWQDRYHFDNHEEEDDEYAESDFFIDFVQRVQTMLSNCNDVVEWHCDERGMVGLVVTDSAVITWNFYDRQYSFRPIHEGQVVRNKVIIDHDQLSDLICQNIDWIKDPFGNIIGQCTRCGWESFVSITNGYQPIYIVDWDGAVDGDTKQITSVVVALMDCLDYYDNWKEEGFEHYVG